MKILITLSSEVLAKLDRLTGPDCSRSAVIESIMRQHLYERTGGEAQIRDIHRLNHAAERLNAEGADVLKYQSED